MVLVVDDQLTTTQMLRHVFEREGYLVEVAHDGLAGLEAARRLRPDLILLDVLMPVMNGFEVLHHLRQEAHTADIPCIVITANAQEPTDVARGISLGADDYLRKPFAPQELLARASSKIRAYRLEQALHQRTRELEALLRSSEAFNQSLEIDQQPDIILRAVLGVIPVRFALLRRLDVQSGTDDTHIMGHISVAQGERLLEEMHTLHVEPAQQGLVRWRQTLEGETEPVYLLHTQLSQRDAALGLLLVGRPERPFIETEERLFEGISQQAAMALHNGQLYRAQATIAQQLEERVALRTEELKSAQQLLIRSEKLASIGHLAANIAHEINNPLMPIRTLLEDMVEDLDLQQVAYDQRGVQIIFDSIERIRGIVSRLLEFARDSGHEMQGLDLTHVLQGIVHLNERFFLHEGVTLATDLQPLPPIYGSRDQLEQVFMNLALNAQAAMPGGGILTIRTRVEQANVLVEFADTGIGIAESDMSRIFEPFYSTKPSGTGLGLFVSHGIIEAHQGNISVRSDVGNGTIFTITLPVYSGT